MSRHSSKPFWVWLTLEKLPARRTSAPSPVEAFLLAERLRMEGAAVCHLHPETHEPHCELGVMGRIQAAGRIGRAPGRAVVHEHSVGKPVPEEGPGQLVSNRSGPLISAGAEVQRKAGAVVQDRDRIDLGALSGREVALEIHLPELVRSLLLEAGPAGVFLGGGGFDQSVPIQDGLTGRGGRHLQCVDPAVPVARLA